MTFRHRLLLTTVLSLLSICSTFAQLNPKREFRGAWLSTVWQSQYAKNTTEQNKQYLSDLLDRLQETGVNAVLFQVRPSADAFYDSKYEPWSRFLTKGGKAPVPYWDPLQYMIDEAHLRGMELHAWLNPYRVTTVANETLAPNHIFHKEGWRFVKYEGDSKIYFDPGLPENREFIANVIKDIVARYDVDGIHFDDYFYPYPANKKDFPDDSSYAKYGNGMKRADWRRQNVDQLIELVHKTIRDSKRPWVRFGISPFGIWRNKASDPRGSETNGLQNYDDLYADVLLWAQKGWVDYLIPQIYWELEHKSASYLKLVDWWPNALPDDVQLYIGQDVDKTMTKPDLAPSKEPNQLKHKIDLTRKNPKILGNCWWPAYSLTDDVNGAATVLREGAQSTPALVPAYPYLVKKRPSVIKNIKESDGYLFWKSPKKKNKVNDPVRFIVYRLPSENVQLINEPRYIYEITTECSVPITMPGYYTVTAIDHANIESLPVKFIHVVFE